MTNRSCSLDKRVSKFPSLCLVLLLVSHSLQPSIYRWITAASLFDRSSLGHYPHLLRILRVHHRRQLSAPPPPSLLPHVSLIRSSSSNLKWSLLSMKQWSCTSPPGCFCPSSRNKLVSAEAPRKTHTARNPHVFRSTEHLSHQPRIHAVKRYYDHHNHNNGQNIGIHKCGENKTRTALRSTSLIITANECDECDEEEKEGLKEVTDFLKKRGFVYSSCRAYGGFKGVYDYGPRGVELIRNLKNSWWKQMVHNRDDIVGLDSAILSPAIVWKASSHLSHFTSADGSSMMFKTNFGHHRRSSDNDDDDESGAEVTAEVTADVTTRKKHKRETPLLRTSAYLRPETAQGAILNFNQISQLRKRSLPFGIAQIGKAFRNETTAKRFLFRMREFTQMEIEYFTHKEQANRCFEEWIETALNFVISVGVDRNRLKTVAKPQEELSHYAQATVDVLFEFPWGYGELLGVTKRGDFDIKRHLQFDADGLGPFSGNLPFVVEPSWGLDRLFLAMVLSVLRHDTINGRKREFLAFPPHLAPCTVMIMPLVRANDKILEKSSTVCALLRRSSRFVVEMDCDDSIGFRYREADSDGVPFAVTIDDATLHDNCVTVRERNSSNQTRIHLNALEDYITRQIENQR